jgi:hypothetical protein
VRLLGPEEQEDKTRKAMSSGAIKILNGFPVFSVPGFRIASSNCGAARTLLWQALFYLTFHR